MQELQKKLDILAEDFEKAYAKLEIEEKISRLEQLEKEVAEPEVWRDVEKATAKNQELAKLNDETQPWVLLRTQLEDIRELIEISDDSLRNEITGQIDAMKGSFDELKKSLRFTGPYDDKDAIVRITSGAGGTEAMDWASMLERMYLRYFENKGFKVTLLERVAGEEAGIKTAVYEVSGVNVYGLLKSEHGVHRLVRLSPFNANNLRQTSFALVEILPVIKANTEVMIDEKDLRIDVYHSGGHGGQSVNTTNSAVRITHIPTNTVVAIQNERSQLQNKEKAMEILRGKLVQMQLEQHAATIGELRAGESAGWGQQIRNYVLQPYKLVKDTRTGYEETDPDAVLDGKLDGLIEAYLENA
ncbi:peptide chain release factor 2 [Candidatus Saccharibacteria bacterium]|nr:peptide chain release factor 2 [Candidatus Saccharibacteria bacterium]MBR3143613.1 peptide chain release factor 2 [Candidatus Saccharibacteria bacterium]